MTGALPRLLVGSRRRHFAQLVGSGVAQALLIVVTAMLMPVLLGAPHGNHRLLAAGGLGIGALALGYVRYRERVYAERLGQNYVQEIRTGLIASSLVGPGPNVGITIARTTNDLNSVRNWIALGITPLVVGIPVLGGTLVALAVLHPLLAVAVGVPLAALGIVLAALSRPHYARSRELRRLRGGLAAQVSDTVQASVSIRAGGGERREVRRIEGRGQKVADAAVARAGVAGQIRGVAMAAAGLASVAVAAVGAWGGLPGATIATALTIVGVLAGPISDLGRVVEYRQSFRAACLIIGPALAVGATRPRRAKVRRDRDAPAGLVIRDLVVDDRRVADLDARPGEAIVLRSSHPGHAQAVLDALVGLDESASGHVDLAGAALLDMGSEQRRALVGHAARGLPLERGSVKRLVRYRRPGHDQPVGELLQRVGLAGRVTALPKGADTSLRRGGQPLTVPEQAQVKLARALYGDPALLVLDHLDAQLGAGPRRSLRTALAEHPGVVLVASDDPDDFLDGYREWHLDEDCPDEARPEKDRIQAEVPSFVARRSR